MVGKVEDKHNREIKLDKVNNRNEISSLLNEMVGKVEDKHNDENDKYIRGEVSDYLGGMVKYIDLEDRVDRFDKMIKKSDNKIKKDAFNSLVNNVKNNKSKRENDVINYEVNNALDGIITKIEKDDATKKYKHQWYEDKKKIKAFKEKKIFDILNKNRIYNKLKREEKKLETTLLNQEPKEEKRISKK
jgi:hypothetical protein